MVGFFDSISKPGAPEFLMNMGLGLMAAGQSAPPGTNRVGLMAPHFQAAAMAPRQAQQQQLLSQLGQAQLAQAQRAEQEAARREQGMARVRGLMTPWTNPDTGQQMPLDQRSPFAAMPASQREMIAGLMDAGMTNEAIGLMSPAKRQAPIFQDKPLPGDKIQRMVSYDQGQTFEPFGEAYDRREPFIIQESTGPGGEVTRFAVPRAAVAAAMTNQMQGQPPSAPPAFGQPRGAPVLGLPGTAQAAIPGSVPLSTTPPKPEKPTEGQSNAALYATRMSRSHEIISGLEDTGASMGGIVGSRLPNVLKSDERQKLEQAQRDFVNAVLRRESGATISDQEFRNASEQYFPQPGDSEAVIKQKRENRMTAIDGIKNAAGPAGRSAADPLGIR